MYQSPINILWQGRLALLTSSQTEANILFPLCKFSSIFFLFSTFNFTSSLLCGRLIACCYCYYYHNCHLIVGLETSQAESSFSKLGSAHLRMQINEPSLSPSWATNPWLKLGSMSILTSLGLSSGSWKGTFRAELSPWLAQLGSSSNRGKRMN